MVAALLAPRAPERPLQSFRWPLLWSERRPLLERQHDRLEAQLEDMIERHNDGRVELDPAEASQEWSALEEGLVREDYEDEVGVR